ncbi:hypothetical protein [Phyllobacterium sp. SB3]|uniref:hypothetical protein n=1 Tax=Phyllobacterium sp. SB3 TaxID=3156073 RepID=UPI0032AE971E
MKTKLLALALMLSTTGAYASNSDALKNHGGSSNLQTVLSGKADPGETVRSRSNPNVSFRVLQSGTILRTNEKYGTEYRWRPEQEAAFNNRKTNFGH